jgi:hypothetical protein
MSSELYRSGTRLRARVLDAQGTRHHVGWYDAELGADCAFHPTEDGALRCVPGADSLQAARFSDPACSTPVAAFDACRPGRLPYVAVVMGAQPLSGEMVASYRVTSALPAGQLSYGFSNGVCVLNGSEETVYQLEKVPPAELVSATRRVETRGATLAVEVFEGADGSSYTGRTFDAIHQRACILSSMYGVLDDYRCYGASTSRVADVGCSVFGSLAGSSEEIVLELEQGTPSAAPSFHRMGLERDVGSVLSRDGRSCDFTSAAPLPDGLRFYETGAPVSALEFPELISDLRGAGRLRLSISRAVDDDRALFVNPVLGHPGAHTPRFRSGTFWDTERGTACEPRRFSDGSTRCVPVSSPLSSDYVDPACQTPILVFTELEPETLVYDYAETACGYGDVRGLYRTGPLQSRTNVYRRSGGSCELAEAKPAYYYDLLAADPKLLAELEAMTE